MKRLKLPIPFLFLYLLLISTQAFCQLTVTPGLSAAVLASTLAGPGVTILNPMLTCPAVANGTFTATHTLLGMSNGILLTNGHVAAAIGPYGPPPGTASFNDGAAGDPALTAILGGGGSTTYDACILQFDVVAKGDSLAFNYQFGSQEYYSAVCSQYNDLFAFFISGPGIVGTPNMALIPGTTIPVEINTVNNGVPGSSGGRLANCTSVGAGSPFTAYYVNNDTGTQLSYYGFTTKFRAVHAVSPCDTYHLNIAIADAANAIYDSGVFLEAGSLSASNYYFSPIDSIGAYIDGMDHTIVRGCYPASVTVLSSVVFATATTVYFTYGGTGVHGIDYTAPDSATLAAGADSISFTVTGIPAPPGGVKTVTIYLSTPFSCGILDSLTINIIDTPSAAILTPDTSVCAGTPFLIRTTGTPGLSYVWAPATGLSSPTASEPIAAPAITTTYSLTATLPGSGCPPIDEHMTATVINSAISILTPPTSICNSGSVDIVVSGSPSLTYSWSPATGLSNPHTQDPVATPAVTTTYVVTATASGSICTDTASITITFGALSIAILTPDTTICSGASLILRTSGSAGLIYNWVPAAGLSSASVSGPVASPAATTTYTLTASGPASGCPPASNNIMVTVVNTPVISLLNSDTLICPGSSVNLDVTGSASLLYKWTPATGLNNAAIPDPVAAPAVTTTYTITATDPTGLCTVSDSVTINVGNPDVTILTSDTSVCVGAAVQIKVNGNPALTYSWSPATGLSDTGIMNPIASPGQTTTYVLTSFAPGAPCDTHDTLTVSVFTEQLTNVTTNQTILYGSSVQLNADNALYYMWAPDNGTLNNPNINNPVATPLTPTTYVVTGMDKYGCAASDTVTINLAYDTIFIPNAFTPNGDGKNDVFRVGNLGSYNLEEMSVYNRWGNLVYHVIGGDNKGWDGTYYGVPQDMGIYNYLIIIGKPQDGTRQIYKGNVTLIR